MTASERIREAREELEGTELNRELAISDLKSIAGLLAQDENYQGEASDLNKIRAWMILNG